MICTKCNIRLKCVDSREAENTRYRKYQCPKCKDTCYSDERIVTGLAEGTVFALLDELKYKRKLELQGRRRNEKG